MGKSPTLNNIDKNFSRLKKKLGLGYDNYDDSKYFYIIVIMYLFLSLLILLYYKPKNICNDKRPYEYESEYKISYSKFLLYYLLLQMPLLIYIMCSNLSSR